MSPDKPFISVILSFRNEEEVIPHLLNRLENVFETLTADYELIFVNDDSTDRSLVLLKEKALLDTRIKILNMSRRFGVPSCLMTGLRYASGDAAITMDADLQDPPEVIPKLIEKWLDGAEIVYTVRDTRSGESPFKTWVTGLAYRILKNASHETDLPVEAGDFRLLSRHALRELLKFRERNPYLRGLVRSLGFTQVAVPYHREKRYAGKTHFPLLSLGPISTFLSGLLSFSDAPVRFLWILSGVCFFLNLILGAVCLRHLFLGQPLSVGMLILTGIFTILSFQSLTAGILGLYLYRLLVQSHRRPESIVESTVNFDSRAKKDTPAFS